jgi:Kef-type K+ transport system membrane component KefB
VILAATGDSAVAGVLVDLFVVLLAAKLGDELFKRIGQPTIVGEILAGVVLGSSVLGLVEPTETLEVFAELGVVFLLFWVGLETKASELAEVGATAALVGALGFALPLVGGIALGVGLGESASTSIFIGAALVATSVGITSAVLIGLGVLGSRPARVILGAAVVDDILAMVLLAIAVGIAAEGGVAATEIVVVVALAVGFVAFFGLGGTRLLRRQPQLLQRPRFSESPLLPAVLLALGLAAFAAEIGLAAIIGAFLAWMMVAETKEQHPIEDEVAPLYAFFPPFFFVFIGLQVDLGAFADAGTLALLAGVTVLAVATKFVGAWLGARSLGGREAAFVGVGMVPRGEVGIIVAGIGRAAGVIDDELFAVIVGMSILTTLAVPPLLRALAPTAAERPRPPADPGAAGGPL